MTALARRRRRSPAAGRFGRPSSDTAASLAARAAHLRRLELAVLHRVDGSRFGEHLALRRGLGSERAGARPYSPGDDARQMDWNVTARSLLPHVRTTEPDRDCETSIVVDRSASLDFGTAEREKRDVVLGAAAAFGFLGLRGHDSVRICVCGLQTLTHLAPIRGRAGLLAGLSQVYDTPRMTTPPGPGADLLGALERIDRGQRRRSQVVILSDFSDPTPWPAALGRLALRHQVIVGIITDPRELDLPDVGILHAVDPESGRELTVDTRTAAVRRNFAVAAAARQAHLRRALQRCGADVLDLSTGRDWLTDTVRFVANRRHPGRAGALRGAR